MKQNNYVVRGAAVRSQLSTEKKQREEEKGTERERERE